LIIRRRLLPAGMLESAYGFGIEGHRWIVAARRVATRARSPILTQHNRVSLIGIHLPRSRVGDKSSWHKNGRWSKRRARARFRRSAARGGESMKIAVERSALVAGGRGAIYPRGLPGTARCSP